MGERRLKQPRTPPTRPGTGMKWRWYTVLLLTVAVLLQVVLARLAAPEGGSDAMRSGYRAGRMLGGVAMTVLIAWIPSVIVYFIAGRSRMAFNISVSVISGLLILLSIASMLGALVRAAG